MTQDEIAKNNFMIADFMGTCSFDGAGPSIALVRNAAKFHCEPNWIWPVIEKIESITDDFHGHFDVVIYSNSCTIQGSKFDDRPATLHLAYFNQEYADTKMQAVYAAVVVFVKWYSNK